MHIDWVILILRWLHIVAAVVALGGAVFMRFVLLPSMPAVPDAARSLLREEVRQRFGRVFLMALVVLLLTGFYNFLIVTMPLHPGDATYHALIGGKIALAFGVFALGSALTGRAAASEPLRRRPALWLSVNIAMALAIIALAGMAHAIPPMVR